MNSKRNLNELYKLPLIIISGPTAVGKTALSLKLARAVDGEIISADSMQVYRGMNIGTDKIPTDKMQGVRHHLIDIIDPDEEWNVSEFKNRAKAALSDITSRGKIPVLTGGTGFYIQALLYDIDFKNNEENNSDIRRKLEDIAKTTEGQKALYERLLEVDPVSCEKIHANNLKRVIRALEFYELYGKKISEHNSEEAQRISPYNFAYFVLNNDRELMYKKIEARIDEMLKDGLVDEVKKFHALGYTKEMTSMQGLGYKEILSFLNGDITLDEAVSILKRDTRHFAKRQLTWFKREKDAIWLDRREYKTDDELLKRITEILQDKKIINSKGNKDE